MARAALANKPACSKRSFTRTREIRSADLFALLNRKAFGGQLPEDLPIAWSTTLKTTAGRTHLRRTGDQYQAQVELSVKVIDDEERLQCTLAHELCHAAAWLLQHISKPPHGRAFRGWARRCEQAIPGLRVTTRHDYAIHWRYTYHCVNSACAQTIGRQSKSIDIERHVCGRCGARLALVQPTNADGTPRAVRPTSGFSRFVQEQYAAYKQRMRGASHGAVMRILSAAYAEHRAGAENTVADATTADAPVIRDSGDGNALPLCTS